MHSPESVPEHTVGIPEHTVGIPEHTVGMCWQVHSWQPGK